MLNDLPCDVEPKDMDETRFHAWRQDTRSPAAKTLERARDLIDGDRDKEHGNRHDVHQIASRLWTAYLGVQIKPTEVACCMTLLKIARTKTGNGNGDNFVDAAGYMALAGELAEDHGC